MVWEGTAGEKPGRPYPIGTQGYRLAEGSRFVRRLGRALLFSFGLASCHGGETRPNVERAPDVTETKPRVPCRVGVRRESALEEATWSEVVANPAKYDQTRIRLRGYFVATDRELITVVEPTRYKDHVFVGWPGLDLDQVMACRDRLVEIEGTASVGHGRGGPDLVVALTFVAEK